MQGSMGAPSGREGNEMTRSESSPGGTMYGAKHVRFYLPRK